MPPSRSPSWIKQELTFEQVRDLITAEPGCVFEQKQIGSMVGGRFVRTLPDGKTRPTYSFMTDRYAHRIDPGTVASWCQALDLDCTKFGVDEPWG
jgi:hypothetical protein